MDMPLLQYLSRDENHTFQVPVKRIHEGKDVVHFLTSKAYRDIMTFLLQLNRAMFPSKTLLTQGNDLSIVQVRQDIDLPESGPIWGIQALLNDLDKIIDQVPLDTGPRRFGNVSFRKWHQKVEEQAADLLNKWLQLSLDATSGVTGLDELIPYFLGSFGSAQRLDYGSGHELSFLAFLGCIWKLGGFADVGSDLSQDDQARAIVLGPIRDYFRLVRRLIKTYTLEPAGSHGVWGLDDHSFIPYVFGSAQCGPAISNADDTPIEGSLVGAPDPADVAKITAVNRYRDGNMYFGAIGFIHDVKTGPFWEHSPMLYDISGVKAGWGKINKGMIKMYNAEVLSKFPVVQHFPFGSLFSWDTDPNAPPPPPSSSSVHTSSPSTQPFSLPNIIKSTSTEKVAPARPEATGTGTGAKAPWPTSAPPIFPPRQETSRRRAQQAQSTGSSSSSSLPAATSKRPTYPTTTTTAGPAGKDEGKSDMAPPTRAPWAK